MGVTFGVFRLQVHKTRESGRGVETYVCSIIQELCGSFSDGTGLDGPLLDGWEYSKGRDRPNRSRASLAAPRPCRPCTALQELGSEGTKSFQNPQLPIPTKTHYFCRVPINSIYGFILGTYKIVGFGWFR